jgi:sporulation protein YlmC with PRC-barrel domain
LSSHVLQIVPKRDNPHAIAPGLLAHLSDVEDDYMIADSVPDFRRWPVTLRDGRRVGTVDDVVLDTSTMTGKYVEVKVDHDVLLSDEDRWVLVPVESVRLDDRESRIVIDHLPVGGLADAPRHRDRLPTLEEQRAILAYFEIMPAGVPHG